MDFKTLCFNQRSQEVKGRLPMAFYALLLICVYKTFFFRKCLHKNVTSCTAQKVVHWRVLNHLVFPTKRF